MTPEAHPPGGGDSLGAEVARLRDELVQATPSNQIILLAKLRDGKGTVNTDALAAVIPLLHGAARTRACDALAERLTRMTAATLRDKLHDPNSEVRRAAALACAMKGDRHFIPNLIGLLGDPEPRVARAAHTALVTLARQDLGPARDATDEERNRAALRWRDWWAKNESARPADANPN